MKDLSLHILDIVQNSIRAKATLIRISIEENLEENQLIICISDNGRGMSPEELIRACDPFYTSRTTRKVGLGLSLFKQNAEMTGGSFQIESEPQVGTVVTALFTLNHPDRPIMGDLTGTLLLLICSDDGSDYLFKYETKVGFYGFDTREIKETLGDVPINHPEIRAFLGKMIRQNLEQIQISES
jgi:hypothetical protein